MGEGVVAILGLDSFLAEAALGRVVKAAVGDDRDAVQVLRGDETTWTRVIDAAGMRSLFSERRVLVVRGADQLKGEGETVPSYLADPTPGVTLVLVAAKPDKRKTVWKKVVEAATVHSADPLKGAKLRGFVSDDLRRRGLRVSADGVEELIERVGGDLRRLMGEVDKLEAYGEGKALGADEVAKVLGRGMGRPLYVMADALAGKQVATALAEVEDALEDGERPELMLAALHRSLRQMRGTRALLAARASRDEIARRLGLPPNMAFKVPALLEAARRWRDGELEAATAALAAADQAIKLGAAPSAALAAAVTAACAKEGPARPARPSGK
jgi:DNA polymerase-3 subunit delta